MKSTGKLGIAAIVLVVGTVTYSEMRAAKAMYGLSSTQVQEVKSLKEKLSTLKVGDFIETQEGLWQVVQIWGSTNFKVLAKEGETKRVNHQDPYEAVENWRTVKRVIPRTDPLRPQPEWEAVATEFYGGK